MVAGILDLGDEVGQEELAARLEARVAEVVGRLNQAHVELVEIAALAAASGAWAGPGLRSLPHWLTWQAGVSTPPLSTSPASPPHGPLTRGSTRASSVAS
jgi:hypothetical protein